MKSQEYCHIDSKGYIRTIHILEYYHPLEKRPDFIFDHCRTKNEATGLFELRPRNPHNEDNVQIYYQCPKGAEALIYKERQIGWTCDLISCITADIMLELKSFTAFWQSIDDEHSCEVIERARGIVENFDFPVPPDFTKGLITGAWDIEIAPRFDPKTGRRQGGKDAHLLAFTKRPTHITGKTPSVYVIDECCKFDPPNMYEKIKREAKAATRTARVFKTSTTLFGNSFEKEIKMPPIIGPSYEEDISSFKVPTFEEWLKARDELARKNLNANVETATKKLKGNKAKN